MGRHSTREVVDGAGRSSSEPEGRRVSVALADEAGDGAALERSLPASDASELRPEQPIPFGDYVLERRIRTGGMAELHCAHHRNAPRRPLAIKRMLPWFRDDPDHVAMFRDEGQLALRFAHPSIVPAVDVGEVDGAPYIALDYVEGTTLGTLLRHARERHAPMPPRIAMFIARRVLVALHYAHELTTEDGLPLGIVHRDVSPENVLIGRDGRVWLTDFGLARSSLQTQRTQAGVLKGTHAYLSPEQAALDGVDRRSDVFAVGAVLYEMLTTERLFEGRTDASTLSHVRRGRVPRIGAVNPLVSQRLEAIVRRALSVDPAARFQDARAMERALVKLQLIDGALCTAGGLAEWLAPSSPSLVDPDHVTTTTEELELSDVSFTGSDAEVVSVSELAPGSGADPIAAPTRASARDSDLAPPPVRRPSLDAITDSLVLDDLERLPSVVGADLDWDEDDEDARTDVHRNLPSVHRPRVALPAAPRAQVAAAPEPVAIRPASARRPTHTPRSTPRADPTPRAFRTRGRGLTGAVAGPAWQRLDPRVLAAALAVAILAMAYALRVDRTPGMVHVTTTPLDAHVSVDGELVGALSPVVIDALSSSERHVVTVEREGFKPWHGTVYLAPGEVLRLPHVELAASD